MRAGAKGATTGTGRGVAGASFWEPRLWPWLPAATARRRSNSVLEFVRLDLLLVIVVARGVSPQAL